MSEATRLLEAANCGDHKAAADLLPLVYDELRKLAAAKMAREKPGHTLDATALVHEAYLRLLGEQQLVAMLKLDPSKSSASGYIREPDPYEPLLVRLQELGGPPGYLRR